MKLAVVFGRVSTLRQAKEGWSIERQIEEGRKLAKELGYPDEAIIEIREEGVSGHTPWEQREFYKYWQMLKEGKVGLIVFDEPDRFAREAHYQLFFERESKRYGHGIRFVKRPPDDSPEGKVKQIIDALLSELETAKTRERTISGKLRRAMAGLLPAGSHAHLYGYLYVKGKGEGRGIRIIYEDEAKWVRQMFIWLVEEGLTIDGITLRLRSLKVPTPTENKLIREGKLKPEDAKCIWDRSTVHQILKNEAYIGKTYAFTQTYVEPKKPWKTQRKRLKTGCQMKPREEWIEIPNATPLIISEELFRRAQEILRRNKELASRNAHYNYLLSGFLYCMRCKRRYRGGQSLKIRGTKRYKYLTYYCPGRRQLEAGDSLCENKTWSANKLEGIIKNELKRVLINPRLLASYLYEMKKTDDSKKWEEELIILEKEKIELDNQEEQLLRAFCLGFEERKIEARLSRLKRERKRILDREAFVRRQLEAIKSFDIPLENIETFCQNIASRIDTLSFDEWRLILKALDVRIWIDRENLTIEAAVPIFQDIESSEF